MDVRLRRATREDLSAILALYADDELSLHTPEGDAGVYEERFAAIESDPRTAIHVATLGEAVVGTIQLTERVHLTGKVMHVESVHVASGERSQGIGTHMMRWALADARARGCTRVELTTQKRRASAHRFYERLGFVSSHAGMKMSLAG